MEKFQTQEDAYIWMKKETAVQENVDNFRFAFKDDEQEMIAYREAKSNGCCGYFDRDIIVDEREAVIGCNFGH